MKKETYVYCSKLFPFGDLMIREGFEIRFKFRHKVSDALVDFLENLDIKNNHYHYEKKITLNLYNSSFIFIPQEVTDLQKLISDYIFMCDRIIGYIEKRIKIESPSEINLKFSLDDIYKTYERLSVEFPNSKYKVNSRYLFCRDLLPFGDVIINNAFQIKIEMDQDDFKTIENTLLQMDFNFNYKYEMFLYQEHESRLYFNFRPLQWENLDFLISDYIDITKEILKKTEKVVLK